jgi:Ca2+-binding EF-hand superfamily protein
MISKMGIFITTQELTAVYNQFDHNRDGMIAYEEFVNTVKVR